MKQALQLFIILLISLLAIGNSTAQTTPQRIRFATGATSAQIIGTVSQAEVDRYVFRAFEGQTVFVNAGSAVSLNVFDPDGVLLITTVSDVYQSIVLQQTGDYIIQIGRAQAQTTISYTLDLQIYGSIDIERDVVERIQFEQGAISATLVDSLLPNQLQQYAFYAFKDQVMSLTVLDASFYVIAPDESVLAYRPEHAQNVVLPLTGDYRIAVYPSGQIMTESYSLTLTIVGETTGISEPERIMFAQGAISASVFDTVSGVDSDEYIFGAAAGQNMTLAITNGTMTLVSPSGIPFARGDVAGGLRYINVILPETGDYRVRVFRAADEPEIDYRLDLIIVN